MGDEEDLNARLRRLPGVDRVLTALKGSAPAPLVARAAREAIAEARARIKEGETVEPEEVVRHASELLKGNEDRLLRPVINATGVLIHTNLGRVPLGEKQVEAARRIATGYSNLEFDIEKGTRGSRYGHAADLLAELTAAEQALVVNNNAAAVLTVLAALCGGREVVISRGELIEIGGEFRIPEVMKAAGVKLVEVGTTNRTHLADYERAVNENTAALMKVHPSNYKVVGFTSSVRASELAKLARGRGILFLHDLGSGLFEKGRVDTAIEPSVEQSIEEGADVVTFSGDKLLGGPQAGLILGRSELVSRVAAHPLMRAVRPDKMTLGVLQETLLTYIEGRTGDIPLWRLMGTTPDELEARARALVDTLGDLPGVKVDVVPASAVSGGGSMPGAEIPSWAVALLHEHRGATEIGAALRRQDPPVVGRIEEDRVLLDLRTVFPEKDEALARLVRSALS